MYVHHDDGIIFKNNKVKLTDGATLMQNIKVVTKYLSDLVDGCKGIITDTDNINQGDYISKNGVWVISSTTATGLPPYIEANSKLIVEHINVNDILRTIISSKDWGKVWTQHIVNGTIRGWVFNGIATEATANTFNNAQQAGILKNVGSNVFISRYNYGGDRIEWTSVADFPSGETRPTESQIKVGSVFFDTSLDIPRPIWVKSIVNHVVTWVDATGATV